ncbi:hypothetical protein NPIL_485451 [Nephila pilipes]|uniref:Uncharacterized protein n=1 Tax=Nephila pilipes TaxID=299642 RepID=A0A8X6P634_NEPPI|nr:hypothetical protein NPIL_485451 [Nephila pilipes]
MGPRGSLDLDKESKESFSEVKGTVLLMVFLQLTQPQTSGSWNKFSCHTARVGICLPPNDPNSRQGTGSGGIPPQDRVDNISAISGDSARIHWGPAESFL